MKGWTVLVPACGVLGVGLPSHLLAEKLKPHFTTHCVSLPHPVSLQPTPPPETCLGATGIGLSHPHVVPAVPLCLATNLLHTTNVIMGVTVSATPRCNPQTTHPPQAMAAPLLSASQLSVSSVLLRPAAGSTGPVSLPPRRLLLGAAELARVLGLALPPMHGDGVLLQLCDSLSLPRVRAGKGIRMYDCLRRGGKGVVLIIPSGRNSQTHEDTCCHRRGSRGVQRSIPGARAAGSAFIRPCASPCPVPTPTRPRGPRPGTGVAPPRW